MNRKFWATISLVIFAVVIAPVPASPKLSLMTAPHITPMPLQVFDIVLTTPTRAFIWNFTANLAGKDVGSDRFSFVVDVGGGGNTNPPLLLLFSDQNLTTWLSSPLTIHSGQELAYWAVIPMPSFGLPLGTADTVNFSPPASGTYHIVILNPNAFENSVPGVPANVHIEIHGYETWTTTIIA